MYRIRPEQVPPGTPFAAILDLRVANGAYAGDDPALYVQRHLSLGEAKPSNFTQIEQLKDGRFITVAQAAHAGRWLADHP